MKKMLLKIILPVIGALIFNTLGMTAHASMSSSHGSHESSHVNPSLSCASLCMSLPTNRGTDDETELKEEDNNDYTEPDLFGLREIVSDEAVHATEAYRAAKFDPPPGQPNHIQNAVFRV